MQIGFNFQGLVFKHRGSAEFKDFQLSGSIAKSQLHSAAQSLRGVWRVGA